MHKHRKRYWYQQVFIAFIFIYLIIAIIWWYIELESGNQQMFDYKLIQPSRQNINLLNQEFQRNRVKYISEGITFLVFTAIGWIALSLITFKQYKFIQNQSYFLDLLAHEIKTPITIGKINLQNTLKANHDLQKQAKKNIDLAISEFNHLDMVVNKFLVLLRLENKTKIGASFEKINLAIILQRACKKVSTMYSQKIVYKNNLINNGLYVIGDESLLEILFCNILDNAFRHSQTNQSVQIDFYVRNQTICISILDQGKGIENTYAKHHIFQKYDTLQGNPTSGTGIGLHISRLICKHHRGDIYYVQQLTGSKFVIELPLI